MALVRKYLEARSKAGPKATQAAGRGEPDSAAVGSSRFTLQAAMIARLSEIAARLGELERNSKLGPPGVYLKRIVRKAIGWYSRPAHEFDRAAIQALQQIRLDMLGLQQQVDALQQAMIAGIPAALSPAQPGDEPNQARSSASEQAALLRRMIELFKNLLAVQALRQALQKENPELLHRVEGLLNKVEGESGELKAALLKRLTVDY